LLENLSVSYAITNIWKLSAKAPSPLPKAFITPTGDLVRLRPLDAIIIAAGAALVAASAAWAYAPGSGKPVAVIDGPGGRWVYPLDQGRVLSVSGPLGDTVIEIEGGKARIASSPCPDETCVAAGSLSRPGQWSACLPNRVMLRIEGGAEDELVDAIAY